MILYLAPVLGGGETRLIGEGIVTRLREIETARIGPDIRIRGKVI